MRSWTGFRVVLNRETLFPFDAHSGQGEVIEMLVGHLDSSMVLNRFPVDYESVVLRGDLSLSGQEILHRMIDPAVAVEHLESRYTLRKGYNLVSETDAKKWKIPVDDLFGQFLSFFKRHGVSRAVG